MRENVLKSITIVLVCIISGLSTVFFEDEYREFIRCYYIYFTNNDLTFYGKDFHFFPTYFFIFSFSLFSTFLTYSIRKQNIKIKLAYIISSILLFAMSTLLFSLIDSKLRIIGCTACNDGKLKLPVGEIDYDLIFVISLSIAIVPLVIFEIKRKNLRICGK